MKKMLLGKLWSLFDSYSEQRFVVTVGCGIITSLLCWFGKIDGGTYSIVILGTVAVFIAGQAAEKWAPNPGASGVSGVASGDAANP